MIAFYGIENLTNKTTGGQGHPGSMSWKGRSHTEQTKEKMRQARLGKPGPKRTKEAIEKFKQTIKTNGHFGLGISRDEETKKKISNSLKGIVLTEEQKKRRSLEMKQVWEKRKLGLIPERKKRAKCQIHSMLDQNPITLLEI